jgi:hypothetical protein
MFTRNLVTTVLLVWGLAAGTAAQTPAPARPAVPEPVPATAAEVDARLPGRFLIGANVTNVFTPNGDVGDVLKFGGFFSFRPKAGWGPAFGLSWFRSGIRVPVDGFSQTIGTLRVRPIMAGIGYTWVRGHTSVRLKAVGGYAFTSAKLDEVVPGVDLKLEVDQAWVAQPSLDVMFGVARRLALVGSLKYTVARPMLRLAASDGVSETSASRRLRGDYLGLSVGVAISVF